ncbi:MAG: hypothetical protein ACRES4_02305, partial [Nevskiales bacterium]
PRQSAQPSSEPRDGNRNESPREVNGNSVDYRPVQRANTRPNPHQGRRNNQGRGFGRGLGR